MPVLLFPSGIGQHYNLGGSISDTLDSSGIIGDTLGGIARAGISHVTQKALGGHGKWDFVNVAADAFGNAIGNSIVSAAVTQQNAKIAEQERLSAAIGRIGSDAVNARLDDRINEIGAVDLTIQTPPTYFPDVTPFSLTQDGLDTANIGAVGSQLADYAGTVQTVSYLDARQQAFRGINDSFARGYERGRIAYHNGVNNRTGTGLDARSESLRQFGFENSVWAQGRQNQQDFVAFMNRPEVAKTIGFLQAAEGAVLIKAGALLSSTGLGAIAGVPLAAFGADQFQAGLRTFANEQYVDSFTNQGLQAAGLSPFQASIAEALLGGVASTASVAGDFGRVSNVVTDSGAAATRARVLANIEASQRARASSNFGDYYKAEGLVQEQLGIWPPNRGAYGPIENVTIEIGQYLDRYGFPGGTFVSPANSPLRVDNADFGSRALPSYKVNDPYNVYQVLKPIESAPRSRILPWFGQPGQGVQFDLPYSVQWYIDNDYLKRAGGGQ